MLSQSCIKFVDSSKNHVLKYYKSKNKTSSVNANKNTKQIDELMMKGMMANKTYKRKVRNAVPKKELLENNISTLYESINKMEVDLKKRPDCDDLYYHSFFKGC